MKSKILFVAFVLLIWGCKNEVVVTPNQIILSGLLFTPDSMTVPLGSTVSWLNIESVTHTVTSDSAGFGSGNLSGNSTFNHTFTAKGTYKYHCSIHTMMSGKIIVQ